MQRHSAVSLLALLACLYSRVRAEDPLSLEPSADITITSTESGRPAKSDGERPTLRLMGDAEKHRICMFFELKDQAAKPCRAAVLHLVTDKGWPNAKLQYIRVHRLERPFSERWSSWTDLQHPDMWINPGGDFDPNAACERRRRCQRWNDDLHAKPGFLRHRQIQLPG